MLRSWRGYFKRSLDSAVDLPARVCDAAAHMVRVFLVFAALVAQSSAAFAQDTLFRVLGVKGQVLLQQSVARSSRTLGYVTNALLEEAVRLGALRQYRGSEGGVNSINELGSALEVLSETEMNAYGWCYRVDGVASDLMADEFYPPNDDETARSFRGPKRAISRKSRWLSLSTSAFQFG